MPMPRPGHFGSVDTQASLWIVIPTAASSVTASFFLVLLIFYLEFGELPAFAFGFATFLVVLQILMIIGIRFAGRTEVHVSGRARGSAGNRLGAFWLVACAFGAFLGWVAGSLAANYPQYQLPLLAVKVMLTIVVPVTTMLPNVFYIQKKAAYIQVPILVGVTLLPVMYGLPAALSLLRLVAN